MRVLVTGCSGQLGQKLVQTNENAQVFGVDKKLCQPFIMNDRFFVLDLLDKSALVDLVASVRPQWIVNAAAYTGVDAAEAERELCWKQNVVAVENLIYAARKQGAKVLHVSTDYIFDGKEGPYGETDQPNPLGYYGRSKLASENALITSTIGHAIVRTMVLYGTSYSDPNNFVFWVINALKAGKSLSIVNDQMGNTTLSDELARGIWAIVHKQKTGLFHIAGREITSRFEFANSIADVFDLDKSLIYPITTAELQQKAPRPLRSGLSVDKSIRELGITLSDTKTALWILKRQLEELALRYA